MQAKNITAGECQTLAFHTRNTLRKLREDDSKGFELFWKQVTDGADQLELEEAKLKRKHKMPKIFLVLAIH